MMVTTSSRILATGVSKGVIDSLDGAIQRATRQRVMHSRSVWFPASHRFPACLRSFLPSISACLGQLEFPFPHELGWLESHIVQGPICQTLKTLMHACN